MSLPVSDIVSVQILVAPQAPTARGFGSGNIVGTTATLPLEERVREYTTLAGVGADFQTTDPEYLAATAWFGQSPAPSQPLLVSRAFPSGDKGHLRGGVVSATVATYTGVSNGGFDVAIDGANKQIFGVDLSAQTTMAGIATVLQTKLAAALGSTTCVWTGTHFLITSPTTGTSSTVGFAAAPTGGSSPTDIKTLLGLTAAAGAMSVPGIAAETVTQSLNAIALFNPNFYGVTLTSTTVQDAKDAMAWGEANKTAVFYTTSDANAKLSAATSDLGYYASNAGYGYTVGVYSSLSPDAAVSAMARAFVVDFTQPNSTITLKFKKLPGIQSETLTETERLALVGKNVNYYADFGGFPMLAEGVVANGRFFDEIMGLDWLQATVQNGVFTALATTVTKIPQTDKGSAMLVQAATVALNQGVANGLLAPGVWTGAPLGEVKTGDFLPQGFYVYATPVAQQSTADRAARKSPPISAIAIGAGAIHSCAVTITFQR